MREQLHQPLEAVPQGPRLLVQRNRGVPVTRAFFRVRTRSVIDDRTPDRRVGDRGAGGRARTTAVFIP
jgi:hypothetical protein